MSKTGYAVHFFPNLLVASFLKERRVVERPAQTGRVRNCGLFCWWQFNSLFRGN
jgi:hypothetical protein